MAAVSSELHRTVPGTGLNPNHTFLSNQAKNPPNQYIFARPGDPQNMIVHPAPSQPTPNFSTPPPHIPSIPTQQTFQKSNYPQQVLRYTTSNIPTFQGPKPNAQLVTYRLQAQDLQQQGPPMPQYKHYAQITNPQQNQQQQQIFYPCVPQAEYIPVQSMQNYVPCPQGVLSPPGVLSPQQVCPPVLLNPPSVLNPHPVAVQPSPTQTNHTTPPKLHTQGIPVQTRPQHSVKGKNMSHLQQVGSHSSRQAHPKSLANTQNPHLNLVNTRSSQNGATSPQVPQNLLNPGVQAVYPQFQQPGVHTPRSPNQLPQVVYGIQTPTISNSQKVCYPYPPPSVSPRNPYPFQNSLSQASQVPVIAHPPPTGAPYHVNITYSQPQPDNYPVNLVPYQNPPLVTTPSQPILSQTTSPPSNKPNTEPQVPAKLHIQYKTNSNAKSSPCAYTAQVKTSESVPNNVMNQTSGINQQNQTSGINQLNQNCANNQPCRYNQKPQQVCSGLTRPTELLTCQSSKSNSRFSSSKSKHEFSPSQMEEIPDLRPQFLANQMLPQVGQVVLLPPLPPDRTIQTIQLLTPTTSGQFHMSTIVLPIIKLDNHQPSQYHHQNKVDTLQYHQQTKVDTPQYHHQTKVDTPQYHHQTNLKTPGCQQISLSPHVGHLQTAGHPTTGYLPTSGHPATGYLPTSGHIATSYLPATGHPATGNLPLTGHHSTGHLSVAGHLPVAGQTTTIPQPPTHSATRHLSIDKPGPQQAAKNGAKSNIASSQDSLISKQLLVEDQQAPALDPVDCDESQSEAASVEQLPSDIQPILAPADQIYLADDKVSENPSNEPQGSAQVYSVPTLEPRSNEDLPPSDDELVKLNESGDATETTVADASVVDASDNNNANKSDVVEEDMMLNQLVELTGVPSVVQGIDLDKVKQFAFDFKQARLDLGLTQSQVGADLQSSLASVSQSTICRFERLEITTGQVKRLLPALQQWLATVQERQGGAGVAGPTVPGVAGLTVPGAAGPTVPGVGGPTMPPTSGDIIKKRKKRTVFSSAAVSVLCGEYATNSSPSSQDMARIAETLGHHKETVRVWFCNKRQKEAGLRKQQGEEDKEEDKDTS